jgi:hypothetical protein
VKGDQGDQGIQGPKGDQGDQGIPGPPGGLGEAPNDGQTYGRKNLAWSAMASGGVASSVTFTPTGNIAATNVQAAIAEVDSEKVAKSGDTMSGNLGLTLDDPVIQLNKQPGAHAAMVQGLTNGVTRWSIMLNNYNLDNFGIYRYDDAGAYLGTALQIMRDNGNAMFSSDVTAGYAGTTGSYYFGNSGTKYLQFDGSNFRLTTTTGGAFVFDGSDFYLGVGGPSGRIRFGSTGTPSLLYDGTNFTFNGGNLYNAGNGGNISIVSQDTRGSGATMTMAGNMAGLGFAGLGFNASLSRMLYHDGTNYNLVGGRFQVVGAGATIDQNLTIGAAGTVGNLYFGNTGTKNLLYDGTNYTLTGGNLTVNGFVYSATSSTAGAFEFGTTGTAYLTYNGSIYTLVGGPLLVNGSNIYSGGGIYYFSTSDGSKYLQYSGGQYTLAGATQLTLSGSNLLAGGHVMANSGVWAGYSTTNQGNHYFGNDGTRVITCNGALFTISGAPLGLQPGGSTVPGTNGCLRIGFMGGGSQYGIVSRPTADSTYAWLVTNTSETNIGSITQTSTNVTFNTTSDERLKNVKGAYTPDEAVAIIRADPVMSFTWKSTGEDAIGWIAQKSYAVDPNLASPPLSDTAAVAEGEDAEPVKLMWGIDYGRRTPYLWAAVSQLLDRIDVLEAKLAALEAR